MPITFENENDIIVFPLERVISYARKTHQIFVAQCVWWLASIIGLEPGLIIHIDNLSKQDQLVSEEPTELVGDPVRPQPKREPLVPAFLPAKIHPDRADQISNTREVSTTPRDLAEDQRLDQKNREARDKAEADRQERLRQIRDQVIEKLTKDGLV